MLRILLVQFFFYSVAKYFRMKIRHMLYYCQNAQAWIFLCEVIHGWWYHGSGEPVHVGKLTLCKKSAAVDSSVGVGWQTGYIKHRGQTLYNISDLEVCRSHALCWFGRKFFPPFFFLKLHKRVSRENRIFWMCYCICQAKLFSLDGEEVQSSLS